MVPFLRQIYTFARDEVNGNVTLIDSIKDCSLDEDTVEVCERGNVSKTRFLETANDMALSKDGRNMYVVSLIDSTKNQLNEECGRVMTFSRNVTSGKLTYVEAYFDSATLFFTSIVVGQA